MALHEDQVFPSIEDGSDDRALPFSVEALDVRGRVVTLGGAIDAILQRHDYPAPVKRLLGEATVLAALLATSLKDVGRFILQTQTDGPVSMLVVDIRTPAQIRATATFDEEAVQAAAGTSVADSVALLGAGTLAMTIEQGKTYQRYQGYVALDGDTLEAAAHSYFRQSEQIPTRVRLAVAEMFERDEVGAARQSWRAGGLLGQFLPESEDRVRHRDLPAGDLPEGTEPAEEPAEDDAWREALALMDTVEDHELTDPAISAERLLFRLFHERGVRVFDPVRIEEKCSCSREKIAQVLTQMGPDDLAEAATEGRIDVRCEFCGLRYEFDPADVAGSQAGEGST